MRVRVSPPALSVLHREFLTRRVVSLNPKPAVTVTQESAVSDVIAWICVERGAVVIVVGVAGEPIGIVTERDLLNKWKPQASLVLADLMTPRPQTLAENASVARAIHSMAHGGFRHLPIVASESSPLRVISTKDVVDSIHRRLTAKLLNPDSKITLADNPVDQFFASGIKILEPDAALTVAPANSVAQAVQLLQTNRHGAVVVCDNSKRVLGIFTERDYLTKVVASGKDPLQLKLSELMTPSPSTLTKGASVAMAFSLLSEGGYRHIPIVDNMEKITGVLSVRSFINYLAKSILESIESY